MIQYQNINLKKNQRVKCPNCKIDLIEEEYGSSHTEVTCGGYYCEQCELSIPPKDMEDFVLSALNPEVM